MTLSAGVNGPWEAEEGYGPLWCLVLHLQQAWTLSGNHAH